MGHTITEYKCNKKLCQLWEKCLLIKSPTYHIKRVSTKQIVQFLNLSFVTQIESISVKTCGPPRIDDAVMSNMTVKPGQKVVFNCKVTFFRKKSDKCRLKKC